MKNLHTLTLIILITLVTACSRKSKEVKKVLVIPVYGQSLALGEEAIRITDFDSLVLRTNHRVLTENLDENFGYLSDTHLKQWMKKMLNDRKRAFELSIYGMSEVVSDYLIKKGLGDSILISTFPGGQGATGIKDLSKGTKAYNKFLDEIRGAYESAQDKGYTLEVPAFCWMQGEDDIVWKKSNNYKKDLKTFQTDLSTDVKAITHQKKDIVCISYQTNCLTLAKDFNENNFISRETAVPQAQLELVRDDSLFSASGPTYLYSFAGERVHIDGVSQKRLGYLAGLSVIRLLESKSSKGLTPSNIAVQQNSVQIRFNIPSSPIVLDTVSILKSSNYGFSVIDSSNKNILEKVILKNDEVTLICSKSPKGSKIRYAVNGTKDKSGYKYGPRGNLRDSQGNKLTAKIKNKNYPLHNWCYQFDILAK